MLVRSILAPWAVTLVFVGCAAAGGAGTAAPTGADAGDAGVEWVRRIDPFEVRDPDGAPYELPFLGGFNAPRPQLVDLDGDGDSDLVVQEVTGRLDVFERTGVGGDIRYRWRPDLLESLEVGEWFRFIDAEGDGGLDLLSESPFNYVRLYRGVGGPGELRFEVVADTLKDTRGAPIFSDRQNIPNAVDLDCNGLLDLLIGRLVGTVTRYEATASGIQGLSAFRLVTNRFEGIEIVADPLAAPPAGPAGPTPTGVPGTFAIPPWSLSTSVLPARHGANTMALADIDGDGDLDLFWGDFFEPGLLFIENTGTCPSPDFTSAPVPFPVSEPLRTSGYNAPTFGDLDGDGDLDLLVGVLGGAYNPVTTSADNLFQLVQGERGAFEVASRRFLSQIDVGSESVASLVDLDGDDDLDLLVGNRIDPSQQETAHLYRFENVGGGGTPSFIAAGRLEIQGAYHNAPAFGDLDGDGDLDLVLGTWRPELRYLENVGSRTEARFALVDSAFVALARGSNAAPALGDLDGDGDLDLLVGEAAGTVAFYRNEGTRSLAAFELVTDALLGVPTVRRSFPALLDWDRDGDLDLALGTEANGVLYYENRGDASQPDFEPAPSPFPVGRDVPALAAPAFGDLNGDGDLELFLGGGGGGLLYFERLP